MVVGLNEVADEVRGVGEFSRPTEVVPINDGAARGAGPVVDKVFFVGASRGVFEKREARHGANCRFDVGERGEVEGRRESAGIDIGKNEDKVVGVREAGPSSKARGEVRPEEGRGGGVRSEAFVDGGATGCAGTGDGGVPRRNGDGFIL